MFFDRETNGEKYKELIIVFLTINVALDRKYQRKQSLNYSHLAFPNILSFDDRPSLSN
jgi:hypothetical protein